MSAGVPSRRLGTAARRQQDNLAGAGDILRWGSDVPPPTTDAPPGAPRLPSSTDAVWGGSLEDVLSGAVVGGEAAGVRGAPRVDVPLEVAEEVSCAAATARAECEADHAIFVRVILHRVQEVRAVQALWDAGCMLQVFRYLAASAHESVAVDLLHALSACGAAVRSDNVDATSACGVSLSLVGGFPQWSAAAAPRVEWVEAVAPVLEALLRSAYEDYLSVALHSAGHVTDALAPLFDAAALCTAHDLRRVRARADGGDAPEAGEGVGEGVEGEYNDADADADADSDDEAASPRTRAARAKAGRAYLHVVATSVVRAARALQPLAFAVRGAEAHEGRVAKLAAARGARLRALLTAARPLLHAGSQL